MVTATLRLESITRLSRPTRADASNEEGVKNMDATIQEGDGIMEVRRDKGTEIPPVGWSWHRRC